MAQTPSNTLALGTVFPEFSLEDAVTGKTVDPRSFQTNNGLFVMFICNHCPFVVHIRKELVKVAHEALASNISVIAINSNSIESHPEDGPSHMKELAVAESWRFPFLFDETQAVARAFMAACTPDLYLFDTERRLCYHGQFDDSRPSNGRAVTGADLRAAIRASVARLPVPAPQKPCVGCSIKWKTA